MTLEYDDLTAGEKTSVDEFLEKVNALAHDQGCSCDIIDVLIDDIDHPFVIRIEHEPDCLQMKLSDGDDTVTFVGVPPETS